MKVFFSLLLTLTTLAGLAQSTSPAQPPYKRFPTLPALTLLLSDSTTQYTKADLPKGKPVILMLFSPDCSHCQHTAEELLQYKDRFNDIQLVMATMLPLWQMNAFIANYKLNELPNVVVGKDLYFSLPAFYDVKSLPFLAFYDKKGRLLSVFEGSMSVEKMLNQFK